MKNQVYVLWDSEYQFMLGAYSTLELCKSERDKIDNLSIADARPYITDFDLDKPANMELYKCV